MNYSKETIEIVKSNLLLNKLSEIGVTRFKIGDSSFIIVKELPFNMNDYFSILLLSAYEYNWSTNSNLSKAIIDLKSNITKLWQDCDIEQESHNFFNKIKYNVVHQIQQNLISSDITDYCDDAQLTIIEYIKSLPITVY